MDRRDFLKLAAVSGLSVGGLTLMPGDQALANTYSGTFYVFVKASGGWDTTMLCDPRTSVVNKWNQSHDIPNLFITDGSSMASVSCKNPSVTFMALTARAVDTAYRRIFES